MSLPRPVLAEANLYFKKIVKNNRKTQSVGVVVYTCIQNIELYGMIIGYDSEQSRCVPKPLCLMSVVLKLALPSMFSLVLTCLGPVDK